MYIRKKLCAIVALFMLCLIVCSQGVAAISSIFELYPNYLDENLSRYNQYAAKHEDKSYTQIILEVNLKLDEDNYTNIVTVDDPAALEIFVSKHYALPKGYKPENLVKVDKNYAQSGVTLRADAYAAFLSMVEDMEAVGLSLYIQSGYRTNKKRGGANSLWYAWPGHSEHQTGLAFDLCKKGITYKTLSEYKYHKTMEFHWLCENAHEYGFILSYPDGATDITGFAFEPWHWRYIGTAIATDMKVKQIDTYHEYWATYLQNVKKEAEPLL